MGRKTLELKAGTFHACKYSAMGTQRCHSWLIDSLPIMATMLTGQVEIAWKGGSSATRHGSQRPRGLNSCPAGAEGIQAHSGHGLYLIDRGCPDNPAGAILGSMTKISLLSP